MENWKFYLAGKIAGVSIFIPALFYTIADAAFYGGYFMIGKPEGAVIQRDLAALIFSTVVYAVSDNLLSRESLEKRL